MEDAIAEAKKALEQNELQPLKDAINKINTASHKIAEVMYKGATAAQGAPGEKEPGKQGDVVDAEVVDEQK